MRHPIAERVVNIWAPNADSDVTKIGNAGSGYRIDSRHILTARHVVPSGDDCVVRLDLREDWLPAKIIWRGQGEFADVAVVELGEVQPLDEHPLVWASSANVEGSCVAVGYPEFLHDDIREREQFIGELLPHAGRERGQIHAQGKWARQMPGEEWKGMSGSALFAEGHLIGVVALAMPAGRLLAWPVSRLFEDETFTACFPHLRLDAAALQPEQAKPVPEFVFVAHARGDTLRVAKLCRGLLQRGVRPYFVLWDLLPGPDWQARLQEALRSAPAVLLVDGPSGRAVDNVDYGTVLADRLAREGEAVRRITLPSEGLESEALDELAAMIGTDETRESWLSLEQRAVGAEVMPYRGLRAFGEGDARWMFGRDDEIAELLERFTTGTRFLTVIGASGSGKSSLVMGGLCPLLRSGVLEGGRVWKLASMRPGDKPCESLAKAMVGLEAELSGTTAGILEQVKVAAMREQMLAGDEALRLVLELMVGPAPESTKILLVVDQLEELFTMARLGHDDASPQAMALVRNLIEATRDERSPLRVVSTLRADFLPDCTKVAVLADILNNRSYFVRPHMRDAQIREAVLLPAWRVGFELEPRLLETLVAGAAEQAGRLPLLEHVLDELWRRRDVEARLLSYDAYVEAGGIEGAIAKKAEEQLTKLGDERRTRVRRVMTRLVRVGETTQVDTRRRATLDELGPDDETRQVIDAFVSKARVLVSDELDGEVVIEIAHEALLREWATLVEWINADRDALRLQEEIGRDAKKFAENKDREYLWPRGRLDEARRVLSGSSVELNEAERGFIEASTQAIEASDRAAQRTRRQVRASVVGAFMVLVVLILVVFVRGKEAERARLEAETSEREAEASEREARAASVRARYASMMAGAREVLALDATDTASLLLTEVAKPEEARGWTRLAIKVLGRPLPRFTLSHQGAVTHAAWSPDGKRIITASLDSPARVWNADGSGDPIVLDGHQDWVTHSAWSPDGKRIITASYDKTARVWNADGSGDPIVLDGHQGAVTHAAWSPDGKRIITASDDMTARVWNADGTGDPIVLDGHQGWVEHAAWSPDGKRIVTASHDKTARVWNADGTGDPIVLDGHLSNVVRAAWSPDGKRIITASHDKTARVWNADGTGDPIVLDGHQGWVEHAAWSPDGKRIVTASDDNTARVWNADGSGDPIVLDGHLSNVVHAAWSPDGKRILTASSDNTARVWNADGSGDTIVLDGHQNRVEHAAWSPDGKRIITASDDKTARVWNADGSGDTIVLDGHVVHAAWSPDGKRIITASDDKTARVWNADSSGDPIVLDGHQSTVVHAAWSPDGKRIITASDDKTARVWNADGSGDPIVLDGHQSTVVHAAWSPDGKRIITASDDKTARVWNADGSGDPIVLDGHQSTVVHAAWSPDAKRILTASRDKTARVWNADGSGDPIVLDGHQFSVSHAAWSPDGKRIITASRDKTARVWNADGSGDPIVLDDHQDWVEHAAWSPDGKRILTASDDNTARVWNADGSGDPIVLDGHQGEVVHAAWSPDGKRILTASDDNTARVWNADGSGDPIVLDGHQGPVVHAAWSPDGKRILTASWDKTARVWLVDIPSLQTALRNATSNCLAPEQREAYFAETRTQALQRYRACELTHDRHRFGGDLSVRVADFVIDTAKLAQPIEGALRQNTHAIERCYQASLVAHDPIEAPATSRGRVAVDFVIDPEGKITSATPNTAQTTLDTPELAACVAKAVTYRRFDLGDYKGPNLKATVTYALSWK